MPYFAMEYIADAQPLLEYAAAQGLTTSPRLDLFRKVCDAVHHGHQKGIIHRDLKPGNILVGADGEPKVIDFGMARASDADIVMTTQCTHVGELVGTVHYMSPEQCDGDSAAIDTRSDIYSLGVVLYELLTGASPYRTVGTTVYQAIRVIKDEPPRRPSAVIGGDGRRARHLRGDIDVVLLKALEKDRTRRYASVAEFGEDIRCITEHRPVRARPPSLLYLLGKYVRRNRWKTATATAVAVGLMATLATLLIGQSLRTEIDRRKQEAGLRQAAENARHDAEIAKYGASMSAAATALQAGDPALARTLLDNPAHGDLRGWEWRHLRQRVDQSQRVIGTTSAHIAVAAIDPTGRHVAVIVRDGQEYKGRLYRSGGVSGRPQELLACDAYGRAALAIDRDGEHLAVADGDAATAAELCVYAIDREPAVLLCHWNAGDHRVHALALSPTAPLLLATAVDVEARLVLWDLSDLSADSPAPRRLCSVPNQPATKSLVFSPDGAYLAAAGDDWTIRLFDVERLRHDAPDPLLAVLRGHTYYVQDVAFSADGRRLASASIDGTVRLWDVPACIAQAGGDPQRTALGGGAEVAVLRGHTEGVRAVAFDPDGRYLVSGGVDRLVRVWDLDRRAILTDSVAPDDGDGAGQWEPPLYGQIRAVRGHDNDIIRLGVTPEGEIISASVDGSVRAWLPGTEDVPRLRGHSTSVKAVAFSAGGRFVISGSGNTELIIWDADRYVPVETRHVRHGEMIYGVICWDRDGQPMLAAATLTYKPKDTPTGQGRVLVWELGSDADQVGLERSPSMLPCPPGLAGCRDATATETVVVGYSSLTVSRDGRRLAAAHTSGNVYVWEFETDVRAARLVAAFPAYASGHGRVVFLDEQGDFLATACPVPPDPLAQVATIRVRDATTGSEVSGSPYTRHEGAAWKLAVDPSCSMLASGSADRTIGLWRIDRANGQPRLDWVRGLRGHADTVYALASYPSSAEQRLASGSVDRTVRLWELTSGAEVAALHDHAGPVADMAFDPAGERLASASYGAQGRDNVVRVWDARDDRADPAARRERALFMDARHRVLDTVWDCACRFDAAERRLRDWDPQTAWGRQVRTLALERFDEFVTRPELFCDSAWRVVSVAGRSSAAYDLALRWAQVAARIPPEDSHALGIRGAAEYRCGDFAAALQTLALAKALWLEAAPAPDESSAATQAFLAMTHAALGGHEEAHSELDEARRQFNALVEQHRTRHPDCAGLARLLDEAERHVRAHAGAR